MAEAMSATPPATPAPAGPRVRSLHCPNCGAPVTLRGYAHTLNVACEHCLAILDAKDEGVRILQTAQQRERVQPLIPLGARGTLRGEVWQVIGFQERTIQVEGIPYSWYEYLLFNPYAGFRYLTEYRGHWNFVRTVNALPEERSGKQPAAIYSGDRYRHFQSAAARTTYIIGEFPWQVRLGDTALVDDYVNPPRMLSRETAQGEFTWSLSEYVSGAEVWKAFELPGHAPAAEGIFANQPSPYAGQVGRIWKMAGWALIAWFVLLAAVMALARHERVFERSYSFSPRAGNEPSIVTDEFELKGRPSPVEVAVRTDLANNWAYFRFALINSATGEAYDFGREVSYYFGRDSDGDWTEGKRDDSALIPSVPAGRYYLRVEPEMEPGAPAMYYTLSVTRDVPSLAFFWIALALLLLPPVFVTIRSAAFEAKRWKESDHPPSGDD
jgi:hypothetical protein